MERPIKIILAILLFLCLADMPYSYYQIVRFVAMVGFSWLGYRSYKDGNMPVAFLYIVLALLFQPLFKIALGREVWNVVDVVAGVGLLISAIRKRS